MLLTKRAILYKFFFAIILLFAIYGCQTTNNVIVTQENPVSTFKSEPDQDGVEKAKDILAGLPQTTKAKNEVRHTPTVKISDLRKEDLDKLQNLFGGMQFGHGGSLKNVQAAEKHPIDKIPVKTDVVEDRLFIDLEKRLYGKWINDIGSESYDFRDDGTVTIVVTDKERNRSQKMKGSYLLVEEDRIKIDLRDGHLVNIMPRKHFKISISENEFALTDEPDGPTTSYKRVE